MSLHFTVMTETGSEFHTFVILIRQS